MSEWRVNGTIIIACNCDWGCPCNFNAPPTRGDCEGGWVWAIADGHVSDVSVSGLKVALFADWPSAIHEGGGRAICYVDERADDLQREALTELLHGRLGGPWGIFIKTYELTGPEPVAFDVDVNGYETRCRIGGVVDLELEKIRNPVTQVEVHPELVLPEGLVVKTGRLASSKVFQVRDAVEYDHSGKYAAFGPFDYASAS
jgi:hypothetical protein